MKDIDRKNWVRHLSHVAARGSVLERCICNSSGCGHACNAMVQPGAKHDQYGQSSLMCLMHP